MKHNTIFEIRIHYKNTTPTTIITLNDYTLTEEIAHKIMMRHLENVENKEQVENAHIIKYKLVPENAKVYSADGGYVFTASYI